VLVFEILLIIELSNHIIDYWSIEHLLIIELSITIIQVLIIDIALSIIINYWSVKNNIRIL